MKICWQGFLGKNHSWSICGQNISRSLISLGHQVNLFSTNGIDYFPPDLSSNLIGYGDGTKIVSGKLPDNNYDMSLSYTCMKNFGQYLQHSPKNRFGIWTFEFAGKNSLPNGFAKAHQYCDKILAPSSFARQVFLDSGVPKDKLVVIPHGVNLLEIDQAPSYPLKTKKRTKILINIGQVHRRKNLPNGLKMFGEAFIKKDDICLVIKVQDKKPTNSFELSFQDIYKEFIIKYPNHAEIEIIREFIPNIYSLYKSCDIIFSPSNTEGFGMIILEGLSCGLIPVASNYGGFTDFINYNNALLIEGKEFNVPSNYLYYQQKNGTTAFQPDINSGVEKLKEAVLNIDQLKETAIKNIPIIRETYSWDNVAKQILAIIE